MEWKERARASLFAYHPPVFKFFHTLARGSEGGGRLIEIWNFGKFQIPLDFCKYLFIVNICKLKTNFLDQFYCIFSPILFDFKTNCLQKLHSKNLIYGLKLRVFPGKIAPKIAKNCTISNKKCSFGIATLSMIFL